MSDGLVFAGCSTFSTKHNAKVGCGCTGDRKGVWRIFPTSAETVPAPVVPEAVPEIAVVADTETAPPEPDVVGEAVASPVEIPVIETPRPRHPERTATSGGSGSGEEGAQTPCTEALPKRPPRKAASRRKPKEATEP